MKPYLSKPFLLLSIVFLAILPMPPALGSKVRVQEQAVLIERAAGAFAEIVEVVLTDLGVVREESTMSQLRNSVSSYGNQSIAFNVASNVHQHLNSTSTSDMNVLSDLTDPLTAMWKKDEHRQVDTKVLRKTLLDLYELAHDRLITLEQVAKEDSSTPLDAQCDLGDLSKQVGWLHVLAAILDGMNRRLNSLSNDFVKHPPGGVMRRRKQPRNVQELLQTSFREISGSLVPVTQDEQEQENRLMANARRPLISPDWLKSIADRVRNRIIATNKSGLAKKIKERTLGQISQQVDQSLLNRHFGNSIGELPVFFLSKVDEASIVSEKIQGGRRYLTYPMSNGFLSLGNSDKCVIDRILEAQAKKNPAAGNETAFGAAVLNLSVPLTGNHSVNPHKPKSSQKPRDDVVVVVDESLFQDAAENCAGDLRKFYDSLRRLWIRQVGTGRLFETKLFKIPDESTSGEKEEEKRGVQVDNHILVDCDRLKSISAAEKQMLEPLPPNKGISVVLLKEDFEAQITLAKRFPNFVSKFPQTSEELLTFLQSHADSRVFLISHVEGRQIVALDAGERRCFSIDIADLRLAALSAGVDLYVLGCKSGLVGEMGPTENVRFNVLATAVCDAASAETIGELYRRLSGPNGNFDVFADLTPYRSERLPFRTYLRLKAQNWLTCMYHFFRRSSHARFLGYRLATNAR